MARFPWALPDGFDAAMRKALRNLLSALKNAQRSIPPKAFDSLRSGDLQAFIHLIDWTGVEKEFDAFKQTIYEQAKLSAQNVLENPPQGGVFSQLSFDLIDKNAVEYASRRAGELVVAIQEDMRQTIRTTISDAIAGHHTYDSAARIIRKTLPLSPRDAKAVLNFTDRTVSRLINAGMSPLKAQVKADALAEKYANKLVAKRATTIARTEILHSSMQGRFMGWAEGVSQGLIDGQSVKEWIAETDACDICKPLDGKVVPWDKPFVTEDIEIMMPNAHPNCRCVATILPPNFAGSTLTHEPILNDGSSWVSDSGATSASFSFGKSYSLSKSGKTRLVKHLLGQHDQSTHGHKTGSMSNKLATSTMGVISQETQTAFEDYIGINYTIFNKMARAGDGEIPASEKWKADKPAKFYQNQMHLMDNAIDKSELTQSMELQRVVKVDAFGLDYKSFKPKNVWSAQLQPLIGTTITEKGYFSTTKKAKIPGILQDESKVLIKIHALKGTKAIDIAGLGIAKSNDEGEIIFGRNTKYRVLSVGKGNDNYAATMEVEIAP